MVSRATDVGVSLKLQQGSPVPCLLPFLSSAVGGGRSAWPQLREEDPLNCGDPGYAGTGVRPRRVPLIAIAEQKVVNRYEGYVSMLSSF